MTKRKCCLHSKPQEVYYDSKYMYIFCYSCGTERKYKQPAKEN